MATQEGLESGGFASEWRRLHLEQLELRGELQEEQDPDRRAQIIDMLRSGREQIRSLEAVRSKPATARPPSLYRVDNGADPQTEPSKDSSDGSPSLTKKPPTAVAQSDSSPIVRRGTPPMPDGPPFGKTNHTNHTNHADQNDQTIQTQDAARSGESGDPAQNSHIKPARHEPCVVDRTPAAGQRRSVVGAAMAGALGALLLIGAGILLWTVASNRANQNAAADNGNQDAAGLGVGNPEHGAEELRNVLAVLGLDNVAVELDGSVIHVSGVVATEQEHEAALWAADSLDNGITTDTSGLIVVQDSGPAEDDTSEAGSLALGPQEAALQSEIDRITAVAPVIFDAETSQLGEPQLRVLNNLAAALMGHPDVSLTIVGYTDGSGDAATNRELSMARATSVERYLIEAGIDSSRLSVVANGEEGATGSRALAGLERRVDFEVVAGSADS